jgi:hypothetical protein
LFFFARLSSFFNDDAREGLSIHVREKGSHPSWMRYLFAWLREEAATCPWYGEPDAISNASGYAKLRSRSHDAVIRVYDKAGNVIDPIDVI